MKLLITQCPSFSVLCPFFYCFLTPKVELLESICGQLADGNRRLLIQAPSGSGKTLLCVKLLAGFVADKLKARSHFASAPTADESDGWAVLLLTHSAALAEQTAEEVAVELESRVGTKVASGLMDGGGCPPEHGFAVHVQGCSDVRVHVMTIDGLVDVVRSHTAAGLGGMRYRHVVVDKGHEVFSYQPHPWLVGQHKCEDPSQVRTVLDSVLSAPQTATLVVFHDKSYQHVGVKRPAPVWPERCQESTAPLPIVRNPGPVRDV